MYWYAVRNLYHFGKKESGKNIFEERIICVSADDFSQAHTKGLIESKKYAEENGFSSYKEQLVYKQDGEKLIDGYELWSELYESYESIDEFYNSHYGKYLYRANK